VIREDHPEKNDLPLLFSCFEEIDSLVCSPNSIDYSKIERSEHDGVKCSKIRGSEVSYFEDD
jgi:hypothetical protein